MRPAKKDWRQFFNAEAQSLGDSALTSNYHDEQSFLLYQSSVLQWLGDVRGRSILDVGCGVGALSEPLAASNNVCGVDFAEYSLRFAAPRGLQPICASADKLPFPEDKFDIVLCVSLIQHVDDCGPIMRELYRVTRAGGTLLVMTLNQQSLQRRLWNLVRPPDTFDRMYSLRALEAEFAALGMTHRRFLHLYHPLRAISTHRRPGVLQRYLSTTFAIKGRKRESGSALVTDANYASHLRR